MVRLLDRLRRELGMGMLFITDDARLLHRVADRVVPIGPPPTVTPDLSPRTFSPRPADRVLLDVRELTVTYPEREQPAVSRCSYRIAEGEWLALIGPSGCGKTTLAHWMVGLRPALSGSLTVEGDARPATLALLRQRGLALQGSLYHRNYKFAQQKCYFRYHHQKSK